MPAWDSDHPGQERAETEDDAGDAEEQLRRALEGERHRAAARRYFEAAPLYRVDFEEDGTVSLRKKAYDYWPNRPPAEATRWKRISIHQSLEQAEQRLRHIASPHVYYDERGRLARTPEPGEEERRWPAAGGNDPA